MNILALSLPLSSLSKVVLVTIRYPVILSTFLSTHGTSPHEREMLVGEVEETFRSCGGAEGAAVYST